MQDKAIKKGDAGSGDIWCLIILQIKLLFKSATKEELKTSSTGRWKTLFSTTEK